MPYQRNTPHGIMFHHFYSDKHYKSLGALSTHDLREIIEFIGPKNILKAEEWLSKLGKNTLSPQDVCLTFDDALMCQYDVALPVLNEYGITAFFFVYTKVTSGEEGLMEVFRKFRTLYYEKIDDFYEDFYKTVEGSSCARMYEEAIMSFDPATYLTDVPKFSDNDRKFRYVRNYILEPEAYNEIVLSMMEEKNVPMEDFIKDLWFTRDQVRDLAEKGHEVGLHSHTHPYDISTFTRQEQFKEYQMNFNALKEITGKKAVSAAYPCNTYNQDSMEILTNLGIICGFRANMKYPFKEKLEIPREAHTHVLRIMEKEKVHG